MTLTFVLTFLFVWLLASIAAALLVARVIRTREPAPTDQNDAGAKPSLKKTA